MNEELKNVILQALKEAPYLAGFLLLAVIQYSYNQDLLERLTILTDAFLRCTTGG